MELTKTFRFEASHVLPKHPGKCSRLHGHSWVLHVSVEGEVNPDTGFVMDFAEISEVVKPLIERLDHHHLGVRMEEFEPEAMPFAVPPSWCVQGLPHNFYPTSENLLWWLAGELRKGGIDLWRRTSLERPPELIRPAAGGLIDYDDAEEAITLVSGWSKLSIEETCTSRATLTRKEYDNAYNKASGATAPSGR